MNLYARRREEYACIAKRLNDTLLAGAVEAWTDEVEELTATRAREAALLQNVTRTIDSLRAKAAGMPRRRRPTASRKVGRRRANGNR